MGDHEQVRNEDVLVRQTLGNGGEVRTLAFSPDGANFLVWRRYLPARRW